MRGPETPAGGVTVEGTARRVAVFIGAGALLAAVVGFTVWATSAPGQNNRAGFTAEAAGTTGNSAASTTSSPTTETVTENLTHTRTVRSSTNSPDNGPAAHHGADAGAAGSGAGRAGASMPTGYNAAHDPYLPPHAVVAPAQESTQPSRVYRPSNIVPSPARPMAAPQGANPAAEPTPASADNRTTSQQTPGSTPPREPGDGGAAQTSTAATPAPGGSEVQPSKRPDQPQTTQQPEQSEPTAQPGHGSGPSHVPDGIQEGSPSEPGSPAAQEDQRPEMRMQGAGVAAQSVPGTESAAAAAPQGSAQPSEAPQTPDAATGGNEAPTPVAGKEDVAGYPREKEGVTARDVIDKITGR